MKTLEIVTFEDSGEERMVLGLCQLCAKKWPSPKPEHHQVVSPTGIAHIGIDRRRTACGQDATSEDWWWSL